MEIKINLTAEQVKSLESYWATEALAAAIEGHVAGIADSHFTNKINQKLFGKTIAEKKALLPGFDIKA